MWTDTNALDWLLQPNSFEHFAQEHWHRAALYIEGTPGKTATLGIDRQAFIDRIHSFDDLSPHPRLQATDRTADGQFVLQHPAPSAALPLFDSGHSLILRRVDEDFEALARFSANLKMDLCAPGEVHCDLYMTPSEAGLGMHFDHQQVFIIQLEGAKRWQYSLTPGATAPTTAVSSAREEFVREYLMAHPWMTLEAPESARVADVTLTPGDVLFLPAGSWHNGVGVGYSLSMTVYVDLRNSAQLTLDQLSGRLLPHIDWRQHLPLPTAQERDLKIVPESIYRHFENRLADLKKQVNAITADQLVEQWLAETFTYPELEQPPADDAPLHPATLLSKSTHCAFRYQIERNAENATINLFLPNEKLKLPIEAKRFVETLATADRFTAGDTLAWTDGDQRFSWEEVEPLLTILLRAGVLEWSEG